MEEPKHIFYYMKNVQEHVEKKANALLKEKDLTFIQCHVLGYLNHCENKSASLKDIEKELDVAQSTTAGVILRLEKKNFVETLQDPNDKRAKIIRLTDCALEKMLFAHKTILEVEKEMLKSLTEVEKILFVELLRKIYESGQEEISE